MSAVSWRMCPTSCVSLPSRSWLPCCWSGPATLGCRPVGGRRRGLRRARPMHADTRAGLRLYDGGAQRPLRHHPRGTLHGGRAYGAAPAPSLAAAEDRTGRQGRPALRLGNDRGRPGRHPARPCGRARVPAGSPPPLHPRALLLPLSFRGRRCSGRPGRRGLSQVENRGGLPGCEVAVRTGSGPGDLLELLDALEPDQHDRVHHPGRGHRPQPCSYPRERGSRSSSHSPPANCSPCCEPPSWPSPGGISPTSCTGHSGEAVTSTEPPRAIATGTKSPQR